MPQARLPSSAIPTLLAPRSFATHSALEKAMQLHKGDPEIGSRERRRNRKTGDHNWQDRRSSVRRWREDWRDGRKRLLLKQERGKRRKTERKKKRSAQLTRDDERQIRQRECILESGKGKKQVYKFKKSSKSVSSSAMLNWPAESQTT